MFQAISLNFIVFPQNLSFKLGLKQDTKGVIIHHKLIWSLVNHIKNIYFKCAKNIIYIFFKTVIFFISICRYYCFIKSKIATLNHVGPVSMYYKRLRVLVCGLGFITLNILLRFKALLNLPGNSVFTSIMF